MVFVILVMGSISGVTGPALQGLISRGVDANEQGAVQGALTSLSSVAGIMGPPMATGLFGYFVSDRAPVKVPGIAFYWSAVLVIVAMFLAIRSFRRHDEFDRKAAQS